MDQIFDQVTYLEPYSYRILREIDCHFKQYIGVEKLLQWKSLRIWRVMHLTRPTQPTRPMGPQPRGDMNTKQQAKMGR